MAPATTAVVKRTIEVRKHIKAYSTWCKENDQGHPEDPLGLPQCRKPEIWSECIKENRPLPRDTTSFLPRMMDMSDDEEDDIMSVEEGVRHTAIIDDMKRTTTSVVEMRKLLSHAETSDTLPASSSMVQRTKKKKGAKKHIKLDSRISIHVAPVEACGSDYSSDEEEECMPVRVEKRPAPEISVPPTKRRKIESIVDELSQTPEEREKEFVRITKGTSVSRNLQERQRDIRTSIPSSKKGEKKPVPDSKKSVSKTGSLDSEKTGTEVLKRSEDPPSHPYSQFHHGDHQSSSELRDSQEVGEDDMIDKPEVEEIVEKEYNAFVNSILVTLRSEGDKDYQLKTNSYYGTKAYPKEKWTPELQKIAAVVNRFMIPLKRDLLKFFNVMGEAYGVQAKELLTEISCLGMVQIFDSKENIPRLSEYQEVGNTLCSITGARLQDTEKTNTKRYMTMTTATLSDVQIKSSEDAGTPVPNTATLRVIHTRMVPIVSMVYAASHYYQFALRAFRMAVVPKEGEEPKLKEGYTVKDMFRVVCSDDPDSAYMKQQYTFTELRESLRQSAAMLTQSI